jgi:UDP-N-acetylmuramoyl-L-alanyl-D-glutamate--2,6-diaminopimelate ligase
MEASSHALDQERTSGLSFAGAVFTNFSGDHLDYHQTMEAYLAAKGRLFESVPETGWAILNGDDPVAGHVAARCAGEVLRTSLVDPAADFYADVREAAIDGVEARFFGPWGVLPLRLPLIGLHNVSNALQAAAICARLGLEPDRIRAALEVCPPPPGRLESVDTGDLGITVLVDYAHSDDALQNVLRALRPLVPAGRRLHVVFGCGGDRDRTKRPRMARVAWRLADEVVITSDNPRTEDPQAIIDDIMCGVPDERRRDTSRLPDRGEAILTAISRAERGDVVLIAGKGHEDYQVVGQTKRPFDDRLVAAAAVQDLRARLEQT